MSLFGAGNSYSASLTTTPKATATLVSACTVSTQPINLGDITASSSTLTLASGTGDVVVLCSNKVSYNISLNLGVNNAGQSGRWVIGSLGQKIPYFICSSAAVNAGQTNCATTSYWFYDGTSRYVVNDIGTGVSQSHPSYGFIAKGFYTPDTYTDTITATISY